MMRKKPPSKSKRRPTHWLKQQRAAPRMSLKNAPQKAAGKKAPSRPAMAIGKKTALFPIFERAFNLWVRFCNLKLLAPTGQTALT